MRNLTTSHLGESMFYLRHWLPVSLFTLFFSFFSLQNVHAQCLPPACATGFDPPDYIIDVCDTDCNFVGKNCGTGSAGVACSDVVINLTAMANCLGVDLADCPAPAFNFNVYQGCGENSTSNTEWYYFNPITMMCESNVTQPDGSISIPVTNTTTSITLTVCTTSNNQSYGNFNFTGCCRLDVTCPNPGILNLSCVNALPSPDDPYGQFTALGGVVVESCNPVNITISDQQSGLGCPNNPRTVTRTSIITDPVTQETASCPVTYSIADNIAPTLNGCPPPTVQLACNPDIPTCDLVPMPTATDICGTATVSCTESDITNTSLCGRTKTLTWTATDECLNTATCSTIYNWSASTPITINCPANTIIQACSSQVAVNAAFNAWLGTASFSGGCNAEIGNDAEAPPSACGETVTVTFTVFSECGDPVSCQASFTVAAPTNAALNCPINTTVAACQTQTAVNAQFNAWLATATASGGCNGNLINNNIGAPSNCGGSTEVTFTYFSECPSQTLNCTRTFTVDAPPTIVLNCPINTTAAACQTQAAVNAQFNAWLATATASGGCNGNLINNNIGAPPACGGSTTVTFTYNSACSPFTTVCSASFTVATAATAVLNCPINTTAAACQTQAAINAQFNAWLGTATASGGCTGVLTNNNIGAPSNCGGSTTVTFTYSNACPPLSLNCSATFSVAAPATVSLVCPAPRTVGPCLTQAQLNTEYTNWLASATATGGCNGVLTNNSPGAPLICNTNGSTTTITFNYTSNCGVSFTSCSSSFTVLPYPDFTVPASGAATVACPANATQPTPPVVLDACGKTLTPTGPIVTNNPNPLTCEGTRTYTWTYTDCAGRSHTWSFVYTIERLDFTVPANGSATVACPDETDAVPSPPVVLSNCGEVLSSVLVNTEDKPSCEGLRRYTWRYTDCEGNTHDWVFTYQVVYQDFALPPNESATVECPQAALVPVPPTVYDHCGEGVEPIGPFLSYTYNAYGCEATRTYSFEYTDCSGFMHTWAFVYSFLNEGDFAVYADEYSEVKCIKHAVEPIPPIIYDNCGTEVTVSLSGMTEDIDPLGCMGTRSYVFTYRDCGGHAHDWKFTYFVKDDVAPVGTIPNVDEEVDCLEDVPCPEDDFSAKMAQIIAEGDFYDDCSDPIVSLVSWTEFSPCADLDGDGIYTFGRTYYFSVKDRCGNAYPELIPVNYFGQCQPIGHFNMVDWGSDGGEPAASTSGAASDLQVIQQLLVSGAIKIGGQNRSLTVNDANCVQNLLPGVGGPGVLRNCHQTNCLGCNEMGIGGLKNALAANAIAMELNIRYGIRYEGMTRAAALASPLDCINLHPCITDCNAQGVCRLRIFDAFGVEYAFPYTVGGLQDLVNLYLNGTLDLSGGLGVIYGTALNQSLLMLNAYGNSDMLAALCTDGLQAPWADALIGSGDVEETEWSPSFHIQPNPAYSEFQFQLARMEQPADLVLTLYNSLGQAVQSHRFDQVQSLNERIQVDGLIAGLYIVDVKLGNKHYNTRLMVQR